MPKRSGHHENQRSSLYGLLHGEDFANLRASGLSDETILENGLYTERDPVKLATLLNRLPERPPKQIPEFCQGGGLVFPHYDLAENNSYAVVRPRSPRVRDGKSVKYEAPAGESSRPYFPKRSRPQLRKGSGPIHVTEGAKKALKLSQHGYTAIGIIGVWNWKKKGSDELIDDLAAVQWAGRVVFLAFDFDRKAGTRWNVQMAAKRLARALRKAGARGSLLGEPAAGTGRSEARSR